MKFQFTQAPSSKSSSSKNCQKEEIDENPKKQLKTKQERGPKKSVRKSSEKVSARTKKTKATRSADKRKADQIQRKGSSSSNGNYRTYKIATPSATKTESALPQTTKLNYEKLSYRSDKGYTFVFNCFPDRLLKIPDRYRNCLHSMGADFDVQSTDDQIQYQVRSRIDELKLCAEQRRGVNTKALSNDEFV